MPIDRGTLIRRRTTLRGPLIIGDHCDIGPNTYIGDHTTIRNTEIENTIIMEGTHIDCDRRITDSLIGRNVTIFSTEHNMPRGHRLILGDMSTVTL